MKETFDGKQTMDREPCTWTDCGEPAIGVVSTSGFTDAWVCPRHMDEAIMTDPDRDVWHLYDDDEEATA